MALIYRRGLTLDGGATKKRKRKNGRRAANQGVSPILIVTSSFRECLPCDSHSDDEYSDAGAQAPDNADGWDHYDDGAHADRQSDESTSYISQTDQASQTTTLDSWIDRQRLSAIPKNLSANESIRAIKRLTIQLEQRNPSLLQVKRSSRSNHTLSTTCVPGDEERSSHLHSSENNESGSV